MTTVVFTLKGLDGVPIPNTAFTITAGLPDEVYDPEVVVPPKQTFITDALGVGFTYSFGMNLYFLTS